MAYRPGQNLHGADSGLGVSGSTLDRRENLICIVGGEGTTAMAFHKDTGKVLWRSLTTQVPGYSAPVIYEAADVRQLIL